MSRTSPAPQADKGIVIFSSARTRPGTERYARARELGGLIAWAGLPVITGGGGGSMQAANQGALEKGGISVGVYMKLPTEPCPNPHINELITCQTFFERKAEFFKRARAFVILPGGLGTLDELSEAATHILTQRIPPCPVILMERAFWTPLLDWFDHTLLKQGMIGRRAMELFQLADAPEEAVELIIKSIKC
jgi:uncharacterized protein (TIGR00730 family)